MARNYAKDRLNEVLSAINTYVKNYGYTPTVRELCKITGISSTSTVYSILGMLEYDGLIERDTGHSRGIRLVSNKDVVSVPIMGRVTAGKPILAYEDIDGYIPVTSKSKTESLFALRVSGFSMKNAGILDGDIVIADRDASYNDGDIVIGMDGDEATVKTLRHIDGKVVFFPENEEFDPIYPENPSVLGKVVGSYREY